MGMMGFDRRTRYLCVHAEVALFLANPTEQFVRANVVSRVKNAIANAFATPSFASAVA